MYIALIFVFTVLFICLLIPKARWYFKHSIIDLILDIWRDMDKKPFLEQIFKYFLIVFTTTLLFIVALIIGPAISIFIAIRFPRTLDKEIKNRVNHPSSISERAREPKEIETVGEAHPEVLLGYQFEVDKKNIAYDQNEMEVVFFSPRPAKEVENAIADHLQEIKNAFTTRNYHFVFLPDFNQGLRSSLYKQLIDYYNPAETAKQAQPIEPLTYDDIKNALQIPERISEPCLIRCKCSYTDPAIFSFYKLSLDENGSIMPAIYDYLDNVGYNYTRYRTIPEEQFTERKKYPADDQFEVDIYLIGREIKERISLLRAQGLSSLAIRKLIEDEADKPGRLLIDKHNKLILTDYGNKEIKLEPLQKAVYFLFLRHPEGIYFKDLNDYREELGSIYKKITGRNDLTGIKESIKKLTDPFNNSINEKCARIKNAFVSEFREEVAQWYFIDGKRGERKSIKLPRELVTWDIID